MSKAWNRVEVKIGEKFNRLTILKEVEKNKRGARQFLCRCDCDDETLIVVPLNHLRSGHTKSCGCLKIEKAIKDSTKHELCGHSLYSVWSGIKDRCLNKNNTNYESYGGRGIKICDEWINDFSVFYKWAIDAGWEEGLDTDRINNDGNYEPSNCRFVTYQQNNENKRLLTKLNTSGYRGVHQRKSGFFRATVRRFYKAVYSKSGFLTAKDAAIARDIYCIEHNIPLPLNFPELAEEV